MSEFTEAKRLEVIEKLKEIIPQGLVYGLGKPKPGELCVEAAICLALGEPHGDEPSCVHDVDRDFSIALNDAKWSSEKARAEALLPLAIAQLGTAGKDRTKWIKRIAEGTIRKILPMALRAAAKKKPEFAEAEELERFAEELEKVAVRCEKEGTREAVLAARDTAYKAADYYAAADDEFAAYYATYKAAKYAAAADAALAATTAADAALAATTAYHTAAAAEQAAEYTAKVAFYAADTTGNDEPLKVAVQIALDAYAAET
jgi:hypothetical protein